MFTRLPERIMSSLTVGFRAFGFKVKGLATEVQQKDCQQRQHGSNPSFIALKSHIPTSLTVQVPVAAKLAGSYCPIGKKGELVHLV